MVVVVFVDFVVVEAVGLVMVVVVVDGFVLGFVVVVVVVVLVGVVVVDEVIVVGVVASNTGVTSVAGFGKGLLVTLAIYASIPSVLSKRNLYKPCSFS